jgi:hypothetical protein
MTTYGTSADGVELTDALIDQLTDEAEAGYDVEQLKPHVRRGRPAMGASAATALPVRLDPELRQAVAGRAERDGINQSEVVRRAIRQYLAAS